MTITKEQFRALLPYASVANVERFFAPLTEAMEKHGINTPKRVAAFIAQIAHESGSLRYVEEIASGAAYEGRKDLGNKQPGDGVRFKGRGLIQITGRSNYSAISKAFGVDFVANPELLETPKYAAESAAWWWETHVLNELADAGNFLKITKIINGGTNGLADREKHYATCRKVLNC